MAEEIFCVALVRMVYYHTYSSRLIDVELKILSVLLVMHLDDEFCWIKLKLQSDCVTFLATGLFCEPSWVNYESIFIIKLPIIDEDDDDDDNEAWDDDSFVDFSWKEVVLPIGLIFVDLSQSSISSTINHLFYHQDNNE